MYLGQCDVEMLTRASAIQRTVECLLTEDAAKKFTTVSFKITPQGMTVETENNAYAKFWSDQQRVLRYVMAFSVLVNNLGHYLDLRVYVTF